ncbi:hypothetical protein N7505_004178 [Penicillium chrysogenum]|uniref:Uncharacterized protein n=1 Tax=Penicillium chrysogenum TaxID=5076 RepID=A0ABQ8WSH3_PENCH|nr:hypothetical protein N7505_004178 [Penicillium chrysogenum]KAJ5286101.1 hypothetical protein N7524_001407 [Penicillium chrysogenum]
MAYPTHRGILNSLFMSDWRLFRHSRGEGRKQQRQLRGNGEMVKTPGNRRRLMISISLGIFAQWAGNGVISYYLSIILTSVGVTNVRDYTLISACLQMWDPAFATLAS